MNTTQPLSKQGVRSAVGVSLLGLAATLVACSAPDVDIVSQTVLTGVVNGGALEGRVSATFNTDRGGRSTCVFDKLPAAFNPATLGTHT